MPTFDVRIPEDPLRILIIGAHIDDCEFTSGGTAHKYAQQGLYVRLFSITNGEAGHHEIGGIELTRRRQSEGRDSAEILGVEYTFLDNTRANSGRRSTIATAWSNSFESTNPIWY
jgi:N-acetylglucosamine malate deacetylase 1